MKNVFKYIDAQKNDLINLTKDLVSVNTVNPPGENSARIVDYLEHRCKKIGLKTNRINIPATELKKNNLDPSKKRICLLAKWDTGGKKTLHANGHYDVVPCSNSWDTDPFVPVVKNGRIYGRGTEDMKGSIACYLVAIDAVKKCGLIPACNIELSFTPDEEIGGRTGFGYLVKRKIIIPDYGIGEGYSGNYIAYGNKGLVWFKIEVKGKPAHASKPHKGVNAFELMSETAQNLMKVSKQIQKRKTSYKTRDRMDRFSTMVLGGDLWGNDKTNIVPDLCGFTIDRRFLPEENLKQVKKEIYDAVRKTKSKTAKINTEIIIEQNCAVSDYNNKFSKNFAKAVKFVLKDTPKFGIMAGATDLRFLMEKNIPCVGYSPKGGNRPHADNEYILINSLIKTTKIFAYMFCNREQLS